MQHQCNGIEEWRPVLTWEDIYEVSCLGRVRRIAQRADFNGTSGHPPRDWQGILRGQITKKGYKIVRLFWRPRVKSATIHSLVAEAFLGPRPENHSVNHLNGIRHDNRAVNLEWATTKRQRQHAQDVLGTRYGYSRYGIPSAARLNLAQVAYIRMNPEGLTQAALARRFRVAPATVHRILHNEGWDHWLEWRPCESSCRCPCHFPSLTIDQPSL